MPAPFSPTTAWTSPGFSYADIINQFMFIYVGEDKIIQLVKTKIKLDKKKISLGEADEIIKKFTETMKQILIFLRK